MGTNQVQSSIVPHEIIKRLNIKKNFGFNNYECEGGVGGGLPSME